MFVYAQDFAFRSIGFAPVQEHVVCVDELSAQSDVDAHAEDVAVVEGVGIGVLDFVGCYAGAGAVDVCEIACVLLLYGK